ncbi:unnamed protein product [Schistosoma margrebowiei]|uniref:Uncharacterized protein n=1 Tax=Schistosoma margrebowiei TaxID=48269 RepID=A0A183MDQ5_9TREM|nr:unnamed protein product [Schistosoma margrebowiei]
MTIVILLTTTTKTTTTTTTTNTNTNTTTTSTTTTTTTITALNWKHISGESHTPQMHSQSSTGLTGSHCIESDKSRSKETGRNQSTTAEQ